MKRKRKRERDGEERKEMKIMRGRMHRKGRRRDASARLTGEEVTETDAPTRHEIACL